IQLSLSGEEEPEALRKLADELNLELAKIEGVASVNLSGTAIKEVRVELDQDKLRDFKLSQADVVDVIESNNISMPGDPVLTEGKELTTRIISSIDSLDTLKKLTVTVDPASGNKVSLDDISEVQLTSQDDRTITRTNQAPSV